MNDDDFSTFSFMDFQQLVINGAIFLACLYSFFGRGQYIASYRATMIWIVAVLSTMYAISLLVRIQNQGGCGSSNMTFVKTRCQMQYAISGVELLWSVLLITEGTLNYKQSRDVDWQNKQRVLEEQRMQESAVQYQPDLSLYGSNNNQGGSGGPTTPAGTGTGNDLLLTSVEMEPLPVYMPRPDKDQPMIIDMTNRPAPTYYAPPPPAPGEGSSSSTAAGSSSTPPTSATTTTTTTTNLPSPQESTPTTRQSKSRLFFPTFLPLSIANNMDGPLPQPPSSETSQFYSGDQQRPVRVGSLLLQSVPVTVPTFSKELDLSSIANPTKYSTLKQYLFASLLFKPILALFFDAFSLAFLSAWVHNSVGKGNSSGLVIYALATTGSIAIMLFGGWRARTAITKANIQGIFVNREAYRWVCLTSKDRFLFFERVGQGYGPKDAIVFFTWFTLRDWMQHLLCDLPRLIINCTILGTVAYQQSLKDKGQTPTLTLPDLTGFTHAMLAFNIMLQICNLIQLSGAVVVLIMVRFGHMVSLRKDEHLHTWCQRNLNVRIVRLYKLAKQSGSAAPLRDNNQLQQQMDEYRAIDEENGIDLSMAALAWDTETQDDHVDYSHYAYRPRPLSNGPPTRLTQPATEERIEMTEKINSNGPDMLPPPTRPGIMPRPGSFSYAQMIHFEKQRELHGDNRALYQPMEWKPSGGGTPPDSNPSLIQHQQQQQQQQQFVPVQQQPAPAAQGQGAYHAPNTTHQPPPPPPIPAKDFNKQPSYTQPR
ncbi:hypothetical protein BGZ83_004738 [Gryganskiella cystojenkinii]|nr:hypothetical protein BGZ83_004738 [Gryganskiella cystojenkinii]